MRHAALPSAWRHAANPRPYPPPQVLSQSPLAGAGGGGGCGVTGGPALVPLWQEGSRSGAGTPEQALTRRAPCSDMRRRAASASSRPHPAGAAIEMEGTAGLGLPSAPRLTVLSTTRATVTWSGAGVDFHDSADATEIELSGEHAAHSPPKLRCLLEPCHHFVDAASDVLVPALQSRHRSALFPSHSHVTASLVSLLTPPPHYLITSHG